MKFYTFSLLFFITSCTSIIETDEQERDTGYRSIVNKTLKTCSYQNQKGIQTFGENEKAQSLFANEINNKLRNYRLNLTEKHVLQMLHMLSHRPDIVGPNSALKTLFIPKNGEPQFHSYNPKNIQFSQGHLFKSLELLLKKSNSKRSLKSLIAIYDKHINKSIPIDKDFSNFIKENYKELYAQNQFKKRFFRGKEALEPGETVSPINLSKLYNAYDKEKNKVIIDEKDHLFSYYSKETKQEVQCNQDLNLYENGIYLNYNTDNDHIGTVGAWEDDKGFYISLIGQKVNKVQAYDSSPVFKTFERTSPAAACTSYTDRKTMPLYMVAYDSRDPSQHLHQIINSINLDNSSLQNIENALNKGRSLRLNNPPRLIIESDRVSKKQIDALNEKDETLYHKDKLGKVVIIQDDKIGDKTNIFFDPRENDEAKCQ